MKWKKWKSKTKRAFKKLGRGSERAAGSGGNAALGVGALLVGAAAVAAVADNRSKKKD